jgi:hypothetical protein
MADYYISKVIYLTDKQIIDKVEVYQNRSQVFGEPSEMGRNTLFQQLQLGKTFSTMRRGKDGKWMFQNNVHIVAQFIKIKTEKNLHDDLGNIPLILRKRKTFISHYHIDNEQKRIEFENLTIDLIVNKSVGPYDIESDSSDEYVKQLIQKEYLKDTTVLVVLIGNKTKCRKHVDWEISGALNYKVGDTYAGLLGLILPEHSDYGTGKATYNLMPERLGDNFKTEYAFVADWTEDRKILQSYIEHAFDRRSTKADKRNNARVQMQKNVCD